MTSARLRRRTRSAVGAIMTVGLLVVLGLAVAACGPDDIDVDTTLPTSVASTTSAVPEETTTTTTTEAEIETTTTTAPEETTTTASTMPETTASTEKLASAEIRTADGKIKVMGFIDRVWESGGKRYIRIDYAQLLTGDEAVKAAIKAGQLAPGEELSNDYFILNENPTVREFEVSKSVDITTSTWEGVMEAAATWAEFKSFWSPTPPDGAAYLKESPWWIVRDGPLVLRIDEQYLP